MLPYWFSSMTMKSVGKAALAMVEEVRHQFNTIAGLMEGTARPDYKRCVEISTKVRAARPPPHACTGDISTALNGASSSIHMWWGRASIICAQSYAPLWWMIAARHVT